MNFALNSPIKILGSINGHAIMNSNSRLKFQSPPNAGQLFSLGNWKWCKSKESTSIPLQKFLWNLIIISTYTRLTQKTKYTEEVLLRVSQIISSLLQMLPRSKMCKTRVRIICPGPTREFLTTDRRMKTSMLKSHSLGTNKPKRRLKQ
jgi:hypothetical protein